VTAIETALESATPGSLVVILPEVVSRAIELIEARHPIAASKANRLSQNGTSTAGIITNGNPSQTKVLAESHPNSPESAQKESTEYANLR
jgi:cyanophycin synthetase